MLRTGGGGAGCGDTMAANGTCSSTGTTRVRAASLVECGRGLEREHETNLGGVAQRESRKKHEAQGNRRRRPPGLRAKRSVIPLSSPWPRHPNFLVSPALLPQANHARVRGQSLHAAPLDLCHRVTGHGIDLSTELGRTLPCPGGSVLSPLPVRSPPLGLPSRASRSLWSRLRPRRISKSSKK